MNFMSKNANKLSREPYKGTRDFYPEDWALEKYIFEKMRKVCESFGYVEYNASPLEPAELYSSKTNEEIVNEQTYTFTDRGDRKVTLRPEMTPTVARMIAARRRELAFPLRWYSIPNVFRYEQPQRGRLREHYQLNVDLFGISEVEAEIEIINLGSDILFSLGAKADDFEICINSRKLFAALTAHLGVSSSYTHQLSKLLDKKEKLNKEEFERKLKDMLGGGGSYFAGLLKTNDLESFINGLPKDLEGHESIKEIEEVLLGVRSHNPNVNIGFSPTLMRGFDYYTGIVFEFFDKAEENRRSLFGGGRYDELLSIFDEEQVPAVGFGMGDVTARDFLESHNLLPQITSAINLIICLTGDASPDFVNEIASALRNSGVNVAIDWSYRKLGEQIKSADKQKIPYIVVIGKDEMETKYFTIKNLSSGKENKISVSEIAKLIKP